MKKKYLIICLVIICFCLCITVNASDAPTCKHLFRNVTMIKTSSTATCTKSGYDTYRCLVCLLSGKTSTKNVYHSALGHNWNSDHKCTRCGLNMNGHWFKEVGSLYKCIVCNKTLTISSMSPNLSYRTGYRVAPYDNPIDCNGSVKVTFNEIPYDSNGKLMTVKGISRGYTTKNARYHWGDDIPSIEVQKSVYPPYYMNGMEMALKNAYTSTAQGAKTVTLQTASSGKYVFTVTVNGKTVGAERRYSKGTPKNDDPPTPPPEPKLTIKHIDIATGKEIIDSEYSKTIQQNSNGTIVYSLPIDSNTKYSNYANASYKIEDNSIMANTADTQYIVKVPYNKSNTTITFYYSIPSVTVKHILEDTGEEIIDNELTKKIQMKKPSAIVFSLDVYNKYPILELTGYSIDSNRTNIESDKQYAVKADWNGKDRNIIFYYKYSEKKINVTVKHIDISTGKLMKNTDTQTYSGDKIPEFVSSLYLKEYEGYENKGAYVDGKFNEKKGTTQYNVKVDISNINYSKDVAIEFYYAPVEGEIVEYSMLDAIPTELEPSEVAKIGSNEINNEKYNVEKAIPTSENLYTSVRVYNYILKYSYSRVTDITLSKVTFVQQYMCDGKTSNVSTTYEIPVFTKYYKLKSLEIYDVDSAQIVNEVLPGGSVILKPNNSNMPEVVYNVPETYISYTADADKKVVLDTLEVSDLKFVKSFVGNTEYAKYESPTTAKVRNDELIIDNKVVTTKEWSENVAKEPNKIIPSIMDNKTLYRNKNTIVKTILNGTYTSAGKVTYTKCKNINGSSHNQIIQNLNVNSVNVHTPVVNNITLDNSSSETVNQKINALAVDSNGVKAKGLVLDEEFSITFYNSGTHINEKGYGTRNYNINQGVNSNSYAKAKQIKFPFDVYYISGTKKELIRANTWYTLNLNQSIFKLSLPTWVKEGTSDDEGNLYYIETRVISENAVNDELINKAEIGANLSSSNYTATNKIFVEVLGRVYDLSITNTNDPMWKLASSLNVENQPVGQYGQGNNKYRYALKLGYSVEFNLKTKGLKSNSIVMKPKYYYVDKDTLKIQEVDIYYHTTNERYVKLVEDTILTNRKEENSIATWSDSYKLPASTLVVAKGTKLATNTTDSDKVFLKNGYIIVQFEVETKYNEWDYLSYSKPNVSTQWSKEHATSKIVLPNEKEIEIAGNGNFVIYEANVRANNDYETSGTH